MCDASRRIALSAILFTGLLLVAGGSAQGQQAKLMRLMGGVTHRVGAAGEFVASRPGALLPVGSRVRTDATGRAEMALPSGAVVRIAERTDLVLHSAANAQVTRGQVYARVISGSALQISGPTATAGVKGTTLELSVADDGTTAVTVGEGEVRFFNDLGSVLVLAAQQSVARPGEAPSRPIAIDPASLMAWEATVRNQMIEVEPPPQVDTDPQRLEELLRDREAAAQAAPADAAAQAELARVLLDLGRADEALVAAQAAAAAAPGRAASEGLLGWALLRVGRLDEAGERFAAAVQAEPGSARWIVGQALVALALDRVDEAAQLLGDAAQAVPEDPLPQAYLAAVELRRGDLDAAATSAEAAVRLGPDQHLGHVCLAHVRLLQGDLPAAAAASMAATQLAPASSPAHIALGSAHFFAGDFAAARPELERAVELNPLSAGARLALAKLLAAEGELERALEQARAAVSMSPSSAPARSTLGLLLLLNGDPWAAGEQFAQAVELDPSLAEARTGWAQVLGRQGRFREALGQQEVALALDTDSAAAHNNLGGIYAARGEFEAAVEHLERALELQPGWGLPCANLALVRLEQARYAEALALGERAVELGERSPFVYTVLARIYARQGRSDQAMAALRQAAALDPDYPRAQFQLARLYLEQDRSQDAMRAILGALTRDPSAMLESRRYARSEISASAGSYDTAQADAYTSGQAEEGRLSYFASGMYENTGGWRAVSQDSREGFLEVIGGHQSDPRRQLVLYGTWFDRDAGLPGPVTADWPGDPDDRLDFTGWDALLAWRQRLSRDVTATAKFTWRASELRLSNPGALVAPDASPFQRLEHDATRQIPEVRVEADLSARTRLRAGYAWQFGDEDQSGVVGAIDPETSAVAFEPFADTIPADTRAAWMEVESLVSDQLSVLGGARWGRQEGGPEVALPRFVARYRPDRSNWLALTLDPIFRADIAELAPVEPLADPFGLNYLDFTEGGAARSWALRYQRAAGPGGTLTGALAYQDVDGLLIATQDPALTALARRVLMGEGHRWVADASYEQGLAAGISGRVFLRWQQSAGDFPELALTDRAWPYVPRWQAGGRVDYLDRAGWRVGLEGIWVGERPHDPAGTVVVPSHFVANLQARYQRNLQESYFVQLRNVTDERYQSWLGFPQPGLAIHAGIEYRH